LPPPVPVMVIVYVPTGVVAAVVIVSVDVKAGVPEAGVKLAAAPDGRPVAWRVTVLVKPWLARTLTVEVMDLPCTTEPDGGDANKLKSGAAVTVSV